MGGDEGLETNMVSVKTYIVVVAYGRVPMQMLGDKEALSGLNVIYVGWYFGL